ncbi:MAG: stage II sporulation protein D, partial [bacterium]
MSTHLSSFLIFLMLWPHLLFVNALAADNLEINAKKYVRPMPANFFSRPRRVTNVLAKSEKAKPKPPLESEPRLEIEPPKLERENEITPIGTIVSKTLDPAKGPEIRVALATDVGFAQITSSEPLAYFNSKEQQLVALSVNEVKVQMGTVRERPGQVYRVQVASLKTNQEAERLLTKLRKQFTEPIFVNFDSEQDKYEVVIGDFYSADQAKTFMVQVMNAGYKKTWVSKFEQESSKYKEKMIKAVASSGSPIATANDRMTLAAQNDETSPLYYNGKPYRGQIEIFTNKRGRLSVINRLQMEDYIRGVVANELSPSGFPMLEALKAQAVAARTYAIRNLGQFDAEGYDLLATPLSQVYGGKGTEHQLTNKAVEETWGVIATYQGKPINALYTSTCGGTTESSEFVFTEPVPYLVSVACSSQGRSRRTEVGKSDKS